MDFVTIHHAGLDRTASVPETAVAAFVDRGWTTTDAVDTHEDDQHDLHDDASLNDATPQGSHDTKES